MYKIITEKNNRIINHIYSRYGISKEYLSKYLFLCNKTSMFVISKEKEEIIKKIIKTRKIKLINIGIEIFSNMKEFVPSSLGFTFISAKEIKLNYVILNREQVVEYLKGNKIKIEDILEKKYYLKAMLYVYMITR